MHVASGRERSGGCRLSNGEAIQQRSPTFLPVIDERETSWYHEHESRGYADEFSRGYERGRRDGTMVGLALGAVSAAITVALIAWIIAR